MSARAITPSVFFLLFAPCALGQGVRLTLYDDGLSCPGGCDAHVVYHPSMDGTKHAHSPASPPGRFEKCTRGSECRICFDDRGRECMNVMYRGAGPHRMTFDFTPAFYDQHCSQASLPAALAAQCRALRAGARTLEGRVNCIRNPDHPSCVALMRTARERQAADRPVYNQCQAEGERRFNRGRPVGEQRSNDCAYEARATGGPNRRGVRWRRLHPGACRDHTYVGRDGLDCCNGSLMSDGPLGVECQGFYPAR